MTSEFQYKYTVLELVIIIVSGQHFSISLPSPTQLFPPLVGTGLSHFLDLDLLQLLPQADQDDQSPQLPFTKSKLHLQKFQKTLQCTMGKKKFRDTIKFVF